MKFTEDEKYFFPLTVNRWLSGESLIKKSTEGDKNSQVKGQNFF